jgi:hypothetical protein
MNIGKRILVFGGGSMGYGLGAMMGRALSLDVEIPREDVLLAFSKRNAVYPEIVPEEVEQLEDFKYRSPQQDGRWLWFLQEQDLHLAIYSYQQNLRVDPSPQGRTRAKAAFKRATRGNRYRKATRLHEYAVMDLSEWDDEIRETAEMHYFCANHGLST